MLDTLTKKELVALAEDKGVEVDGRWKRERIVATLGEAGVEPVKKSSGRSGLAKAVESAPVRFQAATGRIRIRDNRTEITTWGPVQHAGLVVDFTSTGRPDALPSGGISREFYPDLDEHDPDDELCSCAKCLAEVRDYIESNKHGIPARWNVMETLVDAPVPPMPGWEGVAADEIGDLVRKGRLVAGPSNDPVLNAVKYEMQIGNGREAIVDALEDIAGADEDGLATAGDVLDAEVEL